MVDGANAHSVMLRVHRVVAHNSFRCVALKCVLIKLLFSGKRLRAAVAFEDTVGGDVISVMFQVSLDLDGLHEEFSTAADLADELGFGLGWDWLVV